MTVLDLFAGPGGWSVALARLGLPEFGVEWDSDAVATARRAGHHRHHGDVRYFDAEPGRFEGLVASPPCQTFSLAGSGSGRRDLDRLLAAVTVVAEGAAPKDALGHVGSGWLDDGLFGMAAEPDQRSTLVLEPMRLIRDAHPEWVALEQVPGVLPVWEAYGRALRRLGYSTAVGILTAEAYGVPQTRRRAILVASRVADVQLPRPTHSRYHSKNPARLDRGVLPWVSMAEALGWADEDSVGFPRLDDGREAVEIDGVAYRARDFRDAVLPSRTVTEKARSWTRFSPAGFVVVDGLQPRPLDRPAHTVTGAGSAVWLQPDGQERATRRGLEEPTPTITGGHAADRRWVFRDQSGTPYDPDWPAKRPATTIAGRGVVTNPGENSNRFNDSSKSRNDGVRVTVEEAGVLQGFPADYPWAGVDTSRYQQVGDAIPPALAEAILWAVVPELVCPNCGNDTVVAGERLCPDCLEET